MPNAGKSMGGSANAQDGAKGETDDLMESLERLDDDVRAEQDLGKRKNQSPTHDGSGKPAREKRNGV